MAKRNEARTDPQGTNLVENDVDSGATKATGTSSNKPVRVFRLRGVKAAIFENHASDNVFHKVVLQRIYREGDEWKTTTSLGRDDLPVARLLLDRAWEFILEKEAQAAMNGGTHA